VIPEQAVKLPSYL